LSSLENSTPMLSPTFASSQRYSTDPMFRAAVGRAAVSWNATMSV